MTNSPRCSIIVPVYNGVDTIERALDALAAQSTALEELEILVVDDGSTDQTAACVEAWFTRHPHVPGRLLQQENAGPAAARNHGARVARAPLLLFTDGDCAPLPDWVDEMVGAFADDTVVGAKGTYVSQQAAWMPRFVQAEYEDRYDNMRTQAQIDFIDTYSAAYRRDIFLDNGGFDAIFTTASVEDQEFSFRLARKGYRMVFVPSARVSHIHDANIGEYIRRKYYIGFWKALLTRWHPERMVQDSHTPQVLKFQIVLVAAMLGSALLALLGLVFPVTRWFWVPALASLLLFVVTSVPFTIKLWRHAPQLALMGLGFLLVRSAALGSGYLIGTLHFSGTMPGQRQPVIPGWKRFIKRMIDIVGALVGLAFTIPLVAIAAIAIKLDSPGPVFYRQRRIGEAGRPFWIFKLRSMVRDAEERLSDLIDLDTLQEPVYKLENDPRVTRVGKFLRRTSLDETPQFYNVLKGEMSLVGPRPEDAQIVALYCDEQRKRLAIKPGMTGPMQVNGRGSLALSQRLHLELDYIEDFSLLRDLRILIHTLPAIWRGNGAY